MLRQVFVIKNGTVLYRRDYAKALRDVEFKNVVSDISNASFSRIGKEFGTYDYFKYKISYITEKELNLIFVFISALSDDYNRVQSELYRLKMEFLSLFGDTIHTIKDNAIFNVLDSIIDGFHRNLKPKISLVGYSGVGKTTITQLIKAKEIPLQHIPTINGEIATIKIGNLVFYLWDFAGQEQFSILWNKFIKGSDAVLLITDSTLNNIERSRSFLELITEEAPYAHAAIIANKQDLTEAVKVEDIERMTGVKAYSMIAVNPNNRDRMIRIIADILEMSVEDSPLLKPLFERENLVNSVETALENGNFSNAALLFEKLAEKCIEIGDDRLGREFYEKSEKLKQFS